MALPPTISLVKGFKIATNGSQHALVVGGVPPEGGATQYWLMLWSDLSSAQYLSIPNWFGWDINSPVLEFVGFDRIVMGSATNGGPYRVNEFQITEAGLVSTWDFTFGDASCRWGDSVRLPNGGVFFCIYRQDQPPNVQPVFRCDAVYRPPPAPNFGPAAVNPYVHQHFDWPVSCNSQFPSHLTMAQNDAGTIHLFWCTDSWGKVGMSRFSSTGQFLDFNGNFLLNPSVERPIPIAANDAGKNRVLLSYQTVPHTGFPNCNAVFGYPIITSQVNVVAVKADGSAELVKTLPWPQRHSPVPMPPIWPRPDGVYFYQEYFNGQACAPSWRFGHFTGSGPIGFTEQPPGILNAYSNDGWIVFTEADGKPTLIDLGFRSTLQIERWSWDGHLCTEVRISWDKPQAGQQLQETVDFANWFDVPGATASPVVLPNTGTERFFRLRQS